MFLSLAVNSIFFFLSRPPLNFFFLHIFSHFFFSFPCGLGAVLTVRDVITRRVLRIRIQKLQPFFSSQHVNARTYPRLFFFLAGFKGPKPCVPKRRFSFLFFFFFVPGYVY